MFNLLKKKNSEDYKFKDVSNTACIICDHVLNKTRPILFASHDLDGGWQFMCGLTDHKEVNAKVISLKEATEIDPSINDLYEMPIGIGAERMTIKDKWIPFRIQDQ